MCDTAGVGVRVFPRPEEDGICVEGGGVMLLGGFVAPAGSGACDSSGVVGSEFPGGTMRLPMLSCCDSGKSIVGGVEGQMIKQEYCLRSVAVGIGTTVW